LTKPHNLEDLTNSARSISDHLKTNKQCDE